MPLIAGAGGVVGDWAANPVGRHGGQVIIAGDQALLQQTSAILADAAL